MPIRATRPGSGSTHPNTHSGSVGYDLSLGHTEGKTSINVEGWGGRGSLHSVSDEVNYGNEGDAFERLQRVMESPPGHDFDDHTYDEISETRKAFDANRARILRRPR